MLCYDMLWYDMIWYPVGPKNAFYHRVSEFAFISMFLWRLWQWPPTSCCSSQCTMQIHAVHVNRNVSISPPCSTHPTYGQGIYIYMEWYWKCCDYKFRFRSHSIMMATLPQLMAHLLPFFMCFFSISIIHFFGGLGLKHLQHLFFNHAFWTITINHIQYYYIQSRHRVHTQWELMYAFIRTYKTFFQYKVYHIVYQTIQVLRRAHHFLLQ